MNIKQKLYWLLKEIVYFLLYSVLYRVFCLLPLDRRKIVFQTFDGKSFSDNPKYIYLYLLKLQADFRYVWVLNNPSPDEPELAQAKLVRFRTLAYIWQLATAKYWIINSHLNPRLKPRQSTIYIQTWHGIPLKKIALDIPGQDWQKAAWLKDAAHWTYFLSPSRKLDKIFCGAFALPEHKILPLAYPRNDIFSDPYLQQRAQQRLAKLALPEDKKVLLYAPTFRDFQGTFKLPFNLESLAAALQDKYVLLLKMHPNIKKLAGDGYRDFIRNVSAYPDIQELMLVADILITDYSSVLFDFALSGKPIILYPYDYESYARDLRGFYFDYEQVVPGPLAQNTADLINLCRQPELISRQYAAKIQEIATSFNEVCAEPAGQRLAELLMKNSQP